MRECFVITTYCNTVERTEELKKCIKNLRQFNIDILIHAHYPLNSDIQNLSTYYLYDSTNPVIRDGSKAIVRWKWYTTANKLLTIPNPDYSYAVMNQWVESLKFLKNKGYDKIHVINYDTFINDFVFRKHQEFLDEYDIVFEYTHLKPRDYNANIISDKNLLVDTFFSIKKSFVDSFTNELTLEKYLQSKDTMLETYLMEVLEKIENRQISLLPIGLQPYKIKRFNDTEFKLDVGDADIPSGIKKEDCDVYMTMAESNGFDLIKKTYKDEFGNDIDWYFVFGGNYTDSNKFGIFIFEITKPIDEIIINIDGKISKINNIVDKYYSFMTNYTIYEIIKIIDNNKLSITINGEKVKQNVIDAMKYQGIQPKFK